MEKKINDGKISLSLVFYCRNYQIKSIRRSGSSIGSVPELQGGFLAMLEAIGAIALFTKVLTVGDKNHHLQAKGHNAGFVLTKIVKWLFSGNSAV